MRHAQIMLVIAVAALAGPLAVVPASAQRGHSLDANLNVRGRGNAPAPSRTTMGRSLYKVNRRTGEVKYNVGNAIAMPRYQAGIPSGRDVRGQVYQPQRVRFGSPNPFAMEVRSTKQVRPTGHGEVEGSRRQLALDRRWQQRPTAQPERRPPSTDALRATSYSVTEGATRARPRPTASAAPATTRAPRSLERTKYSPLR